MRETMTLQAICMSSLKQWISGERTKLLNYSKYFVGLFWYDVPLISRLDEYFFPATAPLKTFGDFKYR